MVLYGILHILSGNLIYIEKTKTYSRDGNAGLFTESLHNFILTDGADSNIYGFYLAGSTPRDTSSTTLLSFHNKKTLLELIKTRDFRENIAMDVNAMTDSGWDREKTKFYGIPQPCEFEIVKFTDVTVSTCKFWASNHG